MSFWICATCAVEHSEQVEVCAICADERQWVPADGQHWTTLEELAAAGTAVVVEEVEPGLYGVTSKPPVGIGQQSMLVTTAEGNLLWDPIGYLDDDAVRRIRELGDVVGIVASHPHMYGVQVEWSHRLGNVPVYVSEADAHWVARQDAVIQAWTGVLNPLPGVTILQPGGHFPGSAVVHWADGAEGKGVVLSGDTIFANPDRTSVSFMRSYPNRIPLSGAVVDRVARALDPYEFDRLYNNFGSVIPVDAKAVVRRSADRHMAWTRGDYDHLT
ncbi:MBL fold metallo-hydrolase [Kribbella sp. NPDC056345]|uniref:MBL fold metallo-hydrolase n=1 Tax=Kribbella sp. NPDC056345 TaxID=3345789 RepID=UPI0035DCF76C